MAEIKCYSQIAILMATYNGEKYLGEQIDSLLTQTCKDWHLYIHDDGSKDCTLSIIKEYIIHHSDRITLLDYPSQSGACHNFLSMLEKVDAPYYMFCDQDDVWLPEKAEKSFRRMQELELQSPERPIIVHSDLLLVDKSLHTLDTSFIRNQHIKIKAIKTFEDYSATNTVTGCTMLFNHYAKKCMKEPYEKAIMHDAWVCLSVASQQGIVDFIDEPLIKYRQHSDNTLGARNMSQQTLMHKLKYIHQQISDNIRHYQEMNAVRSLSIFDFLKAKLRYKKTLEP